MSKGKTIIKITAISVILVFVVAVNTVAGVLNQWLTDFFVGRGTSEVSSETLQYSDALVKEIESEGIVMLKNDNYALPLRKPNVNVFGWASTDAGFVLSGSGSGNSAENSNGNIEQLSFLAGMRKAGFNLNPNLSGNPENINAQPGLYRNFCSKKDGSGKSLNDTPDVFFKLYEPSKSVYTSEVMSQALSFSDTAIIVISRLGGEGQDLPFTQTKYRLPDDNGRTYLELSTEEEDLISVVCGAGFAKVIVVINSMNVMELGFLDSVKINAAISVGGPGQSGCESIGRLLRGQLNPSGRTVDTYAYDLTTSSTFANAASQGVMQYSGMWAPEASKTQIPNQSSVGSSYIDYAENIYIGYKWYETADAEGYWASRGGYDAVVQFPFGYGLSYSKFEWTVKNVSTSSGSTIGKDDEIKIVVSVKNVSHVDNIPDKYLAGKDVVQLYFTPPYEKGKIEKSSVNLLAYAKTSKLEVGESEDVELKFKARDMASYDCYDADGDGHTGYELEKGNYEISLRSDAHNKATCTNAVLQYSVSDDIYYDTDITGNEIKNRFTGTTAYGGVSIDGKTSGEGIVFLSRNDFNATFPTVKAQRNKSAAVINLGNHWYEEPSSVKKPVTGSKSTSYKLIENGEYNKDLVMSLGADYNDERWEQLIQQLTTSELINLVEDGGFQTAALNSVGKPKCVDVDGPTGLNDNAIGGLETAAANKARTVYPVEIVLSSTWNDRLAYAFGQSVGIEAQESSISGWYAPGANIHRSPFDGRNFEYFSEDALLSGKMCANEVYGCLSKGLYAYMKHFAANETEEQRSGLYTWLTEQSLREIYLRPFEIAVKEGKANAMMTSFNCIGAIWSGGNKALLTDIARGEWGFNGSFITDWSNGGDYMNIDQGLNAGGDLWLNGGHYSAGGHDKKNTDAGVADMQRAAKDILYTYCNTYYVANTASDDVVVGVKQVSTGFPIWVLLLIAIDLGAGVGEFFLIRSVIKDKKRAAALTASDSVCSDELNADETSVEKENLNAADVRADSPDDTQP